MGLMNRPRRVLLFCPGIERRKIEKAAGLGADAIILDLEDAVAPDLKHQAREVVVAALAELDFGDKERMVRINPAGSGLEEDDLEAILGGDSMPDAILLPKVESSSAVEKIAWHLDDTSIELVALIETARGIVRLGEIAESSERLKALAFGAEDLVGSLGGVRTAEGREVHVARSLVALHAAAEGLEALDSPTIQLEDDARVARESREALEMGYTGKFAIHPRQIDVILDVFRPGDRELADASRLLEAFDRHRSEGRGVFELDGRMVDMPMVRAAERVVRRGTVTQKG